MLKSFISIALLFLISGCATKPQASFPVPVQKTQEFENEDGRRPKIDHDGLQTYLGLDRPATQLGYMEKSFPTCDVGYGYSSNRNCKTDYFVSIQFQLLCRDSHEDSFTHALGANDMKPLKGSSVIWTLNQMSGKLVLDNDGRGQIKTIARNTQRQKRLKLNIANDNLYVKAGEINKIVTPANWCN